MLSSVEEGSGLHAAFHHRRERRVSATSCRPPPPGIKSVSNGAGPFYGIVRLSNPNSSHSHVPASATGNPFPIARSTLRFPRAGMVQKHPLPSSSKAWTFPSRTPTRREASLTNTTASPESSLLLGPMAAPAPRQAALQSRGRWTPIPAPPRRRRPGRTASWPPGMRRFTTSFLGSLSTAPRIFVTPPRSVQRGLCNLS